MPRGCCNFLVLKMMILRKNMGKIYTNFYVLKPLLWGSWLKATQNGHIWSTFVIPRLLYGLEIQLLKRKNLEKFQRKCLKQIQGLPDNTSNHTCLACLVILPLEPILHKNLLNMFVNMIRNENSIESEMA